MHFADAEGRGGRCGSGFAGERRCWRWRMGLLWRGCNARDEVRVESVGEVEAEAEVVVLDSD